MNARAEKVTSLTPEQIRAAETLRTRKPPDYLSNEPARLRWYAQVNVLIEYTGVDQSWTVNEFCNRAGVPD